jgi:hypothetical protein
MKKNKEKGEKITGEDRPRGTKPSQGLSSVFSSLPFQARENELMYWRMRGGMDLTRGGMDLTRHAEMLSETL